MLSLNFLNTEKGPIAAKKYFIRNVARLHQPTYFLNEFTSKWKSKEVLLRVFDSVFNSTENKICGAIQS